MDFFPTFANIVGAKIPEDRPIDGIDQTDVLLGESALVERASAPMAGYPKLFNIEMDLHEDLNVGGVFGMWRLRSPFSNDRVSADASKRAVDGFSVRHLEY
jgi:hypothetical protein